MPDSLAKATIAEVPAPVVRRFLAVVLVLVVLGLVGAAAVNITVNPRAEFGHRYVAPVVTDAPAEKAFALRQLDEVPEVLVLGTSRGAGLPPSLDGREGFNMAIPGASWSDIEDAYDFAVREQGQPQAVVLALDSFQVWGAIFERPRLGLSAVGWEYQGHERDAGDWVGLGLGTLSVHYTRDSVRALQIDTFGASTLPAFAYDDHGVQSRPREDSWRAAGTFDLPSQTEKAWHNVEARYRPGAEPSAEAADAMVAFVARLESSGVDVLVYLTPFHPAALERLQGMPGFVSLDAATRDMLPRFCEAGADAYDYTEIAAWGGEPDDFYDAYHLTPENAQRLLTALEQDVSPACPPA